MLDDLSRFEPDRSDLRALAAAHPAPDALPFEEVFAPFRRSISGLLPATDRRTCPTALLDLVNEAIVLIARVCAPALLAEFDERRSPAYGMAARLFDHIDNPERELYGDFVRSLWNGGWSAILFRYPVLHRLIALIICRKIGESGELVARIESDHDEICRRFGLCGGAVTRIRGGLSDPHDGLRTVKILEFDSGERVVYKPKDLGLQGAWSDLCQWAGLDLAAPRALQRPSYGWMEYVPQQACSSEDAGRRYCLRSGALVCLLYAVRGTDCHFENLLANGEYPALIDTETLMQPEFEVAGQLLSPALPDFLARHLANSVLQSGMLPSWEPVGGNQSVDAGGLGSAHSGASKPGWRYRNTDYMLYGQPVPVEHSCANVPRIGNSPFSVARYVDDVIQGFENTYQQLVDRREELLGDDGPLSAFRDCPVRFVLRNTRTYHDLLEHAVAPRNLKTEGAFRSSIEEALPELPAWAFAVNPDPIWKAEAAALSGLDIPLFTTATNDDALAGPGGMEIRGAMRRCGWDAAVRQIRAMDKSDMARQSVLIRLAFQSVSAHEPAPNVRRQPVPAPVEPQPEAFRAEARRVADFLVATAIHGDRGEMGWIALNRVPVLDRYTIAPLDHGLWGGAAGIALFLAAVYRIERRKVYRDASLAALARTRAAFAGVTDRALARQHGIGAGAGLGSLIYGLTRAGQWLEDSSLIDDASRIAESIDDPMIAADSEFDVMAGTAGCLLGLLTLHEASGNSSALDRAATCVSRLVAGQVRQSQGGAAWPGRTEVPATGFGHGASGIAYALHRWQEHSGDHGAADAINEALSYERAQFLEDEGNWFDPRSFGDSRLSRCGRSWCSGSPGIGLARLAMIAGNADPEILTDIDAALAFVQNTDLPSAHHLCCGAMGWVDFLLHASISLNRPDLRRDARATAAAIMEQAKSEGGYRLLSGRPDDTANPSLFVGLAGIGYQMLRLADPWQIPSILLFE